MKSYKKLLVALMVALVAVSSFDVEAQSKKTRKSGRKKATTSKTASLTTSEIIKWVELESRKMSDKCPMSIGDMCIIESVSFKNKCMTMTYALTNQFEGLMGGVPSSDFSYMEYNSKLTVSKMIKVLKVSPSAFSKTGISFKFICKDNHGKVLWSKTVTPKEYVAFCNELEKGGDIPSQGDVFNLESLRQMVKSWNADTPQDVDEGLTLTSITMEGTNIYYNYTMSKSNTFLIGLLSEEDLGEIKKSIAQEMYDFFTALDSRERNTVIDNLIKLGITVNYQYFADKENTPFKTISLPASYIKQVGKQKH